MNSISTKDKFILVNDDEHNQLLKKVDFINRDKVNILKLLIKYQDILPDSLVAPKEIVSINNEVYGYLMPYIDGNNLSTILKSNKISEFEKLTYLSRIGNILEELKEFRTQKKIPIYLNDFHEDNIMIDKNNNIFMVDLDGCRIKNYLGSFSRYLTPYSLASYIDKYKNIDSDEAYIKPDENSDIYCYSMMILNYLAQENISGLTVENFQRYLYYLYKLGVNEKLVECFDKLLINCDNVNPGPYLSTVTDEQLAKIRRKTK